MTHGRIASKSGNNFSSRGFFLCILDPKPAPKRGFVLCPIRPMVGLGRPGFFIDIMGGQAYVTHIPQRAIFNPDTTKAIIN